MSSESPGPAPDLDSPSIRLPGIQVNDLLLLAQASSLIRAMAEKCEHYWDVENNRPNENQEKWNNHKEIDGVLKTVIEKIPSDARNPAAMGYALACYLKETGQAGTTIQGCYLLPDDLVEDEISGIKTAMEEAFKEWDPDSTILTLSDPAANLIWVGDHGAVRNKLETVCNNLDAFISSLTVSQKEDASEQPVQVPSNSLSTMPRSAIRLLEKAEEEAKSRKLLQNLEGNEPESRPETTKEEVLNILESHMKIPKSLVSEREMYRILDVDYSPIGGPIPERTPGVDDES